MTRFLQIITFLKLNNRLLISFRLLCLIKRLTTILTSDKNISKLFVKEKVSKIQNKLILPLIQMTEHKVVILKTNNLPTFINA